MKKNNSIDHDKNKNENKKKDKDNLIKYLTCKTDPKLRQRLKKMADREKRSISNLVNFIVEEWLDDNEIR